MDIALFSAAWWAALGSIIVANIVLSGDNAVVIAMAARRLPDDQRQKAIFWGSAAAIIMRILLTLIAVQLLQLPYLKIVGAFLLVYIGVQLMAEGDDDDDDDGSHEAGKDGMMAAVRTILIADLVMSLDNVIAVAAAAKDNNTLLIIGLAVSIPLIVFGSTLLMKVMDRFPIIITAGAALLGYLAGEMFVTDPATKAFFDKFANSHLVAGALGAITVVAMGLYARRHLAAKMAARADKSPG
ncbi:MAG: TerC family protein [Burkholderiales bacterium]|nr:TerC family protein [Burkholderiales bacterium]